MALYQYGSSSKTVSKPIGKTEFEILKESHKFLREEDEPSSSWDEQLASKYYASLYREFALCDLKHYKSGNFALRWRTEEEVISGTGETTCGNTRCEHHHPQQYGDESKPPLTTLELPFAYVEQGESKSALVKIVLCGSCVKKIMWKRRTEKEKVLGTAESETSMPSAAGKSSRNSPSAPSPDKKDRKRKKERHHKHREAGDERRPRERSSRSRSPNIRRGSDEAASRRHRSKSR